jgi:hypothetical protein
MNPETQPTPTPAPEVPTAPVTDVPPAPAPAPEAAPVAQPFAAQPGVAPAVVAGGRDKNFIVALLLSIFLGSIGVDRFYLGNVGLGILKLLTGGVFGILYIIDIVLIATKNIKGVNWVE